MAEILFTISLTGYFTIIGVVLIVILLLIVLNTLHILAI